MKNKKITAILALFLGGLGAHRFYLGQTKRGFLALLFCWTFIPAFIGIFDFIFFAYMSKERFELKYNNNDDEFYCTFCSEQLSQDTVSYLGIRVKIDRFYEIFGLCKDCFKKNRHDILETWQSTYYKEDFIVLNEYEDEDEDENKYENKKSPEKYKFELLGEHNNTKLKALVYILYVDTKRQSSRREIKIILFNSMKNGDYKIRAFCHKRNSIRTFRLSRIVELTDLATGEIYDDPEKYFSNKLMQ